MQDHYFDICIVGGGPAGLSAAYTLAAANLKVAIILEQQQKQPNAGETLHTSVMDTLHQMELFTKFGDLGFEKLAGFESSWGNPGPFFRSAMQIPGGAGWLFDRNPFEAMLLEQFISKGGVVWHGPFELKKESTWQLFFTQDQQQIFASFMIVATGRKGWSHFSLGPKQVVDKLVCFSVRIPSTDQDLTVRLDALKTGWLYTARDGNARAVSLFTDGDLLNERETPKIAEYISQLLPHAPAVRKIVPKLTGYSSIIISSANTGYLKKATGPDWMACGDTAQTYDPLSSQGIVQALRSGIESAQYLIEYWSGAKNALEGYELSRIMRFYEYLNQKKAYYKLEQRWPKNEFWSRRQ